MSVALTSWKEIGQYLGKGVRTVQRWERELALPIRRPAEASRGSVLAYPEELDAWTRTRMKGPGVSLVESLSREVAALRDETAELRARVEFLDSSATQPAGLPELRSDALLVPPAALPNGSSADQASSKAAGPSTDHSSFRLDQVRAEAMLISAQTIRVRIAFVMTLLSVGEVWSKWGYLERAESSLLRGHRAAREIGLCLDVSGYVPSSELPELRGLLAQLESRIRLSTQRIADAMPQGAPKKAPQRAIPRALRIASPPKRNRIRRSA